MTDEQIEKAAQQHADELRVSHSIPGALVPMLHDIAKSSYTYGAQDALSHQWVSVDDRLPNEHEEVLTYSIASECAEDEIATAYYDGEDWYTLHGRHIRPNFWMSIPKLNPEKQSI